MRFDGFDLNLLVALDTLLETRHVSAAARKLCLTQSATSGALARLRDYFGDELLVPVGKRMVPTPKAESLVAPVKQALMLIRSSVTTPSDFDPAASDRTFSIIASDYVFAVLLTRALAAASSEAPNVSFVIGPPDALAVERLARGEIDLVITIRAYMQPHFPHKRLFDDELACISWKGNESISATLTEAKFFNAAHAVVYFGSERRQAFSEAIFAERGFERRIQVQVPTFSALAEAVVGTNRIATLNRRHAEYLARVWPIRVWPLPFETPRIPEDALWHPIRNHDQGLQWLLQHVQTAASSFSPTSRPKKAAPRAKI